MSFLALNPTSCPLSHPSNGGSYSSDDEVFENSTQGQISFTGPCQNDPRQCYTAQNLECAMGELSLYNKPNKITLRSGGPSPLGPTSPLGTPRDQRFIIFSVNFSGKYFGEVGLFEPDISLLDLESFKIYLFASLNLSNPESAVISYNDEENDKIPIDSEIEYREALKIAKEKASRQEKFNLDITRHSFVGGIPESLRSLVTSSIRRVNSVGNTIKPPPPLGGSPQKKDVTTSTSFINLKGSVETLSTSDFSDMSEDSDALEVPSQGTPPPVVQPLNFIVDVDTVDSRIKRIIPTREKIWSRLGIRTYKVGYHEYNRRKGTIFESRPLQLLGQPTKIGKMTTCDGQTDGNVPPSNNSGRNNEVSFYCTFNCHVNQLPPNDSQQINSDAEPDRNPPSTNRANDAIKRVPPITNRVDVETQYQKLPEGNMNDTNDMAPSWFKNSMQQLKEDISQEIASKINERFEDLVGNLNVMDVEERLRGVIAGYGSEVQERVICCCKGKDCKDGETPAVEDEDEGVMSKIDKWTQEWEKKNREILASIEKMEIRNSEFINRCGQMGSRPPVDLNVARERVLKRLEDFRQRRNRSAEDRERHASQASERPLSANIENIHKEISPIINDFDARFVRDKNFPDGAYVQPGEVFCKTWIVMNSGSKQWNSQTYLHCNSKKLNTENDFLEPMTSLVSCPMLLPGEKGRITVSFRAPKTPGVYFSQMKFMQFWKQFGDLLWCNVQVVDSEEVKENVDLLSECVVKEPLRRSISTDSLPQDDPLKFVSKENPSAQSDSNQLVPEDEFGKEKQLLQNILFAIRATKKVFQSCKDTDAVKLLMDYFMTDHEHHFEQFKEFINADFVDENDAITNLKDELIIVSRSLFYPSNMWLFGKPYVSSPRATESPVKQENDLNSDKSEKIGFHGNEENNLSCHDEENRGGDYWNEDSSDGEYSFWLTDEEDSEEDEQSDVDNWEVKSNSSVENPPEETNIVAEISEVESDLWAHIEGASDENLLRNSTDRGLYKKSNYECDSKEPDHFENLVQNSTKSKMIDLNSFLNNSSNHFGNVQNCFETKMKDENSTEHELPIYEENLLQFIGDRVCDEVASEEVNRVIAEEVNKKLNLDNVNCTKVETLVEFTEPFEKIHSGVEEVDKVVVEEKATFAEDLLCGENIEVESIINQPIVEDLLCGIQECQPIIDGHIPPIAQGQSIADELAAALQDLSPDQSTEVKSSDCVSPEKSTDIAEKFVLESKKKECSQLRENFQQNVQVNLDFEIISAPQISSSTSSNSVVAQPDQNGGADGGCLTFMEKHFTITNLPPPNQILAPDDDSDDEGLVFVNKTEEELPSSAPETTFGSPSEQNTRSNKLAHEFSISCSSLSDFREDDHFSEDDLSLSCSSFSGLDDDEDDDHQEDSHVASTNQNTVVTATDTSIQLDESSSAFDLPSSGDTQEGGSVIGVDKPQEESGGTPTIHDTAVPSLSSDSCDYLQDLPPPLGSEDNVRNLEDSQPLGYQNGHNLQDLRDTKPVVIDIEDLENQ